jgi:hypothetical protein
MESLPSELLSTVALYVGGQETCAAMIQTCKPWREALISSTDLWQYFSQTARSKRSGPYYRPWGRMTSPLMNLLGHDPWECDRAVDQLPPWRSIGPSFALGICTAPQKHRCGPADTYRTDTCCGGYELWRRYTLGEEEHRRLVIPFLSSATDFDAQAHRFRSNHMVRLCEWVLPVVLWLLSIAQLAIVAASLETDSFESGWTVPSYTALAAVLALWAITAYPFVLRRWEEGRFKSRMSLSLAHRGQSMFYENVAPPNTRGAMRWPHAILFHALPKEEQQKSKLRRLEMAFGIILSCILVAPILQDPNSKTTFGSFSAFVVLAPAIAGFLWKAATNLVLPLKRCCVIRDRSPRSLSPAFFQFYDEDLEEQDCLLIQATIGYMSAAIGLIGVAVSVEYETDSVLPLLGPYLLASTLLWNAATTDLTRHCCRDPGVRSGVFRGAVWFDCLPCGVGCCFANLLRLFGVATLWYTGITIAIRIEHSAGALNSPTVAWSYPLILAPLFVNFAILGIQLSPVSAPELHD